LAKEKTKALKAGLFYVLEMSVTSNKKHNERDKKNGTEFLYTILKKMWCVSNF